MSDLSIELRGAVARGEITAHYQPQFDSASHAIVSAEVLARWTHPEFGPISPAVFIPLAEQLGLIDELGDHMFDVGCASALDWQQRGFEVEVAINVSAVQLRDQGFAQRVLDAVHATSLNPQLLTIEVTESTEIIDVSAVAERLDWLRSVGVTISVDDFGTGHSSVEQVLELRATELKIDQGLVRDDSQTAASLLGAVVSFAHAKGLRVVAEGVETPEELARVTKMHCDRVQGYLLGEPVDKPAFDELLVRTRG